MTEKEFSDISLTIGIIVGISYMLFIIYKLKYHQDTQPYYMKPESSFVRILSYTISVKYALKIWTENGHS